MPATARTAQILVTIGRSRASSQLKRIMNWDELEKKLMAAARQCSPSDRTPYAFEQRVMARLQPEIPRASRDDLTWWSRAVWTGAAAAAAVAVATGVWLVHPDDADSSRSFSQGIEQALFASADDPENGW